MLSDCCSNKGQRIRAAGGAGQRVNAMVILRGGGRDVTAVIGMSLLMADLD